MPERAGGGGDVFILEMSWRVIAMSSAAAAISGLVFGLLPALRLSDVNLAANIKEHSGTTTGRRGGRFPVLVIGQVALSLAMLTCVSLLLRASQKAQSLDFGFDPARLLNVMVSSRASVDTSESARLALWSAAEKRLRDLPGVEAVAWVSDVSLYRSANLTGERSDGATRTRNLSSYMFASANVLRTKGIQIIRGRDFIESDELAEGVVVIDSATALRIWGSEDPIGKLVKFAPEDRISPWFRVVGVSRSVLTSVPMYEGAETPSSVYMVGKEAFVSPVGAGRRPLRPGLPSRSFVVRGKASDIAALRNAIPAAMRDILPPRGQVFVFGSDDQRRDLIARQRFLAKVFGTFGVLSLALCALGLYSVLAYSVSRRSL
jgi:putative ABC transport system permease protein